MVLLESHYNTRIIVNYVLNPASTVIYENTGVDLRHLAGWSGKTLKTKFS
eukprot:SAG31_NODE_22104_length_533_cov_5.270570_1_plen_49_part_10